MQLQGTLTSKQVARKRISKEVAQVEWSVAASEELTEKFTEFNNLLLIAREHVGFLRAAFSVLAQKSGIPIRILWVFVKSPSSTGYF